MDGAADRVAVVDDRLWFVSSETGELIELDPETIEIIQRLPVEGRPIGLTGGEGRLFVTSVIGEDSLLLSIGL